MRRRARWTLHAVSLAYAAWLCLSAWPFPDAPGIGPVSLRAHAALRVLTLEPGLALFSGAPGARAPRANCLTVEGRRPDGSRTVLFAPECPPRGLRLRQPPLQHALQNATRLGFVAATRLPDDVGALPRPLPPLVRRLLATGDYFCHGEGARGEALESVSLRQVLYAQDLASGAQVRWRGLECDWSCAAEVLGRPRCRYGGGAPGEAEP